MLVCIINYNTQVKWVEVSFCVSGLNEDNIENDLQRYMISLRLRRLPAFVGTSLKKELNIELACKTIHD